MSIAQASVKHKTTHEQIEEPDQRHGNEKEMDANENNNEKKYLIFS